MKLNSNNNTIEETKDKKEKSVENLSGPQYWRSLDELSDTPGFREFVEREFPQGASEIDGVNRRQFMKIMAASFAMAGVGMAGCRRPEQNILPYSKQPENVIPGKPVYFASSMPTGKDNIPLVVETHQNRPTKIEGNAFYEPYGGSTDIWAQASVLDIYDPDRSMNSRFKSKKISKAKVRDLLEQINRSFLTKNGKGLAILAEPSTSLTRDHIIQELRLRMPEIVWAEYEAVNTDNPELATKELFGKRLRPIYNFKKAKRILSIDADFLHKEPNHIQYSQDFASARRVFNSKDADKINRLYQVESTFSLTGAMADHRLRLSSSDMTSFLALIAIEILHKKGKNDDFQFYLQKIAGKIDVDSKWIEECAEDLLKNSRKSVVVAGSHLPLEAHYLASFINHEIKATGKTVNYLEATDNNVANIKDLRESINENNIDTLIILGGNPAYDAPADINFAELLKKVPNVIRFGNYFDETSEISQYHIAATHYLESWNLGRTFDGTIVPVQPMILPLFEGIQELEVLGRLMGHKSGDPYEMIVETVSRITTTNKIEYTFKQFLNNGYFPKSSYQKAKVKFKTDVLKIRINEANLISAQTSKNNLEVRIVPDSSAWDGRYNNNGWLQECPDPITRLTWDNAILISPKLAKDLGYDPKAHTFLKIASMKSESYKRGREVAPMAKLSVNGKSVSGPIHIQPGLADYTVMVTQGYGRSIVGRIGQGTGFSVSPIVDSNSPGIATGAKLELTGETYKLANTQEHWSMEGRAIVREANVEDYQKHSDFVDHMGMESHSPAVYGAAKNDSLQTKSAEQPRGNSLYKTPTFGGAQQWGMTVDLNTCTGCNACVVACQSENNIPIVGKDQVMRGREMHWIRLDRYYSSGDLETNKEEIPSDPQATLMPMLCQQCEMAPCEQVCPVNATVHDDQGLNIMAYNRCVGTRYCANNCPYKVRRFNFFDWNKREIDEYYKGPTGPSGIPEISKMQKNPDVSIRMRGVMEKCTYCQQRIEQAKIAQKVKARDSADVNVPDGTIKTACQQVCPSNSIVFGDIRDASTEVSKIKESDRDYSVLGYLNTRPRTTYLAKLRNPNPLMPDYKSMPLSRSEYNQKSGHVEEDESNNTHHDSSHDTEHGKKH